jgi:phosphatidylinositol alpha-1,6-mannosyltransferase
LERIAQELSLTSATTFLGWRNDVDQLIPLLDVLLISSRYEGFPQTAVQAVTAHVPVIGYAVGGLPELLPADFLVPPGDEDGILAVVTALMRGTLRWPAAEIAQRAASWCHPAKAAAQLVTLLAAELAPVPDR